MFERLTGYRLLSRIGTKKLVNVLINRVLFVVTLLGIALLVNSFYSGKTTKRPGIRKVVIDAGHGGHDPGTLGKKSKEKDVTLAISLKLGRLIKEKYPSVEVIFTRQTDVFVELYRRSQIANESKADLFISIHCNGTKGPTAKGVETWVMGLHKSKENLEVAKKENATILLEDNYSNYDGFDPNSPEATIIFSLFQNVFLDQSLAMATLVQNQFRNGLGLLDRGVKQAGFWVLYKTTMPGILIETGFLSNPDDEAYLLSEKGQDQLTQAIFNAFGEYKSNLEDDGSVSIPPAQQTETTQNKPPSGPAQNRPNETEGTPKVNKTGSSNPEQNPANQSPEKVIYKVQIYSSPEKVSQKSARFQGMNDVVMYKWKGNYCYATGSFGSAQEAFPLQTELQKKGFKDAFVILFYKGERISADEARKIKRN